MPPPPREPWTESKRRLFAAWADAGCPRNAGSVLPPPSQLQEFLALSRALTGFDDLSASLAGRYLTTARADRARKAELDELLALVAESGPSGALMAQHEVLCTYLVLLWYSGAQFGENGFVEDAGEPWRNEYREGLVWRACLAHPMGYSLEPYGHWGDAPDESGLHTGMGAAVDE
jgi:hypothetical protein